MKKIITALLCTLLPLSLLAQAQITTKKMKIADISSKTLKVVLTGDPIMDATLQDDVAATWRISPYEFCDLSEFERIKTSEDHYFMMVVKGQFRKEKEPGLSFLTLVKGGAAASKGIGSMLDVVTMPLCSTNDPSGREYSYVPAYLDIMQEFVLAAMERDLSGYSGISSVVRSLSGTGDMQLLIAESDLSRELDGVNFDEYDMFRMSDEDAAEYLTNNLPGTLVTYSIAPADAAMGSYCYKMIVDSSNHTLYYWKRHKITKKAGPGFLPDDIKKIRDTRSR